MKRAALAIFTIVMLLPLVASADVLEVDVAVDVPELWEDADGFTHVRIEGFENFGLPGTPSLPGRAVRVLLPPGHEVDSVSVRVSEAVEIPGSYLVFPVQRPLPIGIHSAPIFTQPDPEIYSYDDAFPGEIQVAGQRQIKRGFAVQPVVIHPLIYKPLSGGLAYYPWMTVTVITSPARGMDDGFGVRYRGYARDFEQVAGLIDNPETMQRYELASDHLRQGDHRYVIVTNEAMAACTGANNLQALAADKNARGITTMIKTMEDIRSEYSGQDDAEKVRNFITEMYEDHGTDFVLLAGDDDLEVHEPGPGETEETVVPVRGLYGSDGYGTEDLNIPSDVYYACLDGSFNSDGDNKWGESGDDADLLSEVWVGRAPVDNCTEVSNFVRKTLAYQESSGQWLSDVAMIGEWLWESQPSFGKDYLYHVINSSTNDGLDTKGFSESSFFDISGLYDKDQSGSNCQGQPSPCWSADDVLAVLNGDKHIINHLGHSYTYYNMRLLTDQIDSGLSNDKYFFEYTQGCYPGAFDNRLDPQENMEVIWQDCFAEHMVLGDDGAFAAVMNTRYGFGGVSNYFNRTFWDGAFRNGMTRLGELHAYSREQLSGNASNPYFRWVYYECTLFGDPEVSLHMASSTTDPEINLSDDDIWFMTIEGGDDPDDQVLSISNSGGGTLNWTVSSDQSWLQATPSSGTAPSELTLSVDVSGLATDYHDATLTFEAPGATNSPLEQPVTLYIITVPTAVAPYTTGTAPTVDGSIGAGEYNGAAEIALGSWDEEANSAKMLHDGDKVYFMFDLPSDTDEDAEDLLRVYMDVNADDLWPTSAGDEGLLALFAGYQAAFYAMWNSGQGVEMGDPEDGPTGIVAAAGMSGGHRVLEFSIDLSTSHLVREMGEMFSVFLYYEDWIGNDQWDGRAMWPYGLGTMDNTQYFGDIILGTDTDNLVVSPEQLAFSAVQDGEPTEWIALTIGSTTTNELDFTISDNRSWLEVSQTDGTTPAQIRVWADPAGVAPGMQNGTLTITVPSVDSASVPVSFDVEAKPPAFGINPESMYFTAEQDGMLPPSQNLSISNASGSGSLNWEATPVGDWVTVSDSSGTAPSNISVRPDTTDLDAGNHTGAILFTAPGAEPVQVDVSYAISVPPELAVFPEEIVRQDPVAGGAVDLELQVKNTRLGSMNWNVTEFESWLTLEPTGGTAVVGHPGRVTVTLDPAGLSLGQHEADITVSAQDADNSPTTVHVTWTLVDEAAIQATPGSLSFQATVGGSNPAAKALQITNAGPGSLNWTVSCDEAWLSCSPASGSAPGSVDVSVDIQGLSEGAYEGDVVVESADAANSPFEVPVSLSVTSGGTNRPPPAPQLVSPPHQAKISTTTPELTIENVTDPDGDNVTYSFEVYEKGSDQASITIDKVIQGNGGMTYTNLNARLVEGITYQWRARAVDGHGAEGDWSEYWEFSVEGGGGGGCGCTTGRGNALGSLLLLFGLGLLLIRRR